MRSDRILKAASAPGGALKDRRNDAIGGGVDESDGAPA